MEDCYLKQHNVPQELIDTFGYKTMYSNKTSFIFEFPTKQDMLKYYHKQDNHKYYNIIEDTKLLIDKEIFKTMIRNRLNDARKVSAFIQVK